MMLPFYITMGWCDVNTIFSWPRYIFLTSCDIQMLFEYFSTFRLLILQNGNYWQFYSPGIVEINKYSDNDKIWHSIHFFLHTTMILIRFFLILIKISFHRWSDNEFVFKSYDLQVMWQTSNMIYMWFCVNKNWNLSLSGKNCKRVIGSI